MEKDNERNEQEGYVEPTIESFQPEELMEMLGPAQGYGGGGRKPPNLRPGWGRGQRLFPGIR